MLGRILSSEFIQLLRRLDFMARMATKVSICSQFQLHIYTIFLVVLIVNNPRANAGVRDAGSIPGSGRSPGGGHGNPLQYSYLENPMDREPGRLQPIGSQRIGHSWSVLACMHHIFIFLIFWKGLNKRKWTC